MKCWLILLISALGIGGFSANIHAEVFKVVDENGNVTYSDVPPEDGADPAELPDVHYQPATLPTVKLVPDADDGLDQAPVSPVRILLSSPSNEDVITPDISSISVSGSLNRGLQETEQTQLIVNGSVYGQPGKGLVWNVGNLIRGEYRLQLQVLENGRVTAQSSSVRVYVQRTIAR